MLTDIRSGSRWVSAILLSVVLHVGLLALLVVTSGEVGEKVVQEEEKVQEEENVARASSPLRNEAEKPPVVTPPKLDLPPIEEPMTPETIGRADRGHVADIGKGFDESKRVKKGETAFTYYTVKKGDTLTRIAREHGMTPLALAKLNGYAKPLSVKVRVGQKLKVQARRPQP